jgi:hypothetical protein
MEDDLNNLVNERESSKLKQNATLNKSYFYEIFKKSTAQLIPGNLTNITINVLAQL